MVLRQRKGYINDLQWPSWGGRFQVSAIELFFLKFLDVTICLAMIGPRPWIGLHKKLVPRKPDAV
jgi:hypothetical protein